MEDFNSSDIEPDIKPVNQPSKYGARSIEKLRAMDAHQARIDTKKQYKEAQSTSRAPLVDKRHTAIFNQYVAFAETVLRYRTPIPTPKAADIERFLYILPTTMQGRGNDTNKISYYTLEVSLFSLLSVCTFKFSDFVTTEHDQRRFRAAMLSMLKKGITTKAPKREKYWVGHDLTIVLVRSLFEDAINNGTNSWDLVLQKMLMIVLLAACAARSGDITLSAGYTTEHLKWKDVVLKMSIDSEGKERVISQFRLPQKGHKDNRDEWKRIVIEDLDNSENYLVDPIKLLLAHAMRVGVTEYHRYEDLVAAAQRRLDKRIIWIHDEWPVLFGMSHHKLEVGVPCCAEAVIRALKQAARLSGVVERIVPHDLRRGSAKEIAHLASTGSVTGGVSSTVAAALGHSVKSGQVTAQYIGGLAADTWAKRLDSNISIDPFAPVSEPTRPFKRTRRTKNELDEYCKENGYDPTIANDRQNASWKWNQEMEKQWAKGQNPACGDIGNDIENLDSIKKIEALDSVAMLVEDVESSVDLVHKSSWLNKIDPRLLQKTDMMAAKGGSRPQHHDDGDAAVSNENFQESHPIPSSKDLEINDCGDLDIPFALFDSSESEDLDSNDCRDPGALFTSLTSMVSKGDIPVGTVHSVIPDNPKDFVNFLARLNITVNSSTWSFQNAQRGNSRDEPTAFRQICQNNIFGCQYQTDSQRLLQSHEKRCQYQKAPRPIDPRYKPYVEGKGRVCKDCDDGTVYHDRATYERHRKLHSKSTDINIVCPIGGCLTPDRVFVQRAQVRRHLKECHKLPNDKISALLPKDRRAKSWIPRRCTVPDCSSKTVWEFGSAVKAHMKEVHKMSEEELSQYM